MPKILHIIDHMDLGGAQFLAKGIFEKFQNPDLFIFCLRKSDIKINIENKNYFISNSGSKYSIIPIFEILKIIKKYDINILHSYLLKSQIFAWIIKLIFKPDIKLVFQELGEVLMNNRFIYKTFLKVSEKKVNLYFAASLAVKNNLIIKGKITANKIKLLYNYIIFENFSVTDPNQIKTVFKQKYNIGNNEIILGYAGRLSSEKACDVFINSAPFIEIPYKIFIAGNGTEMSRLQKITNSLNLQNNIHFLGFVKNMHDFYSSIDILVIPSKYESFGLIAAEAQSMQIPVIASDIPGLNEVVEHKYNGLLFKRANSKDLAEKINYLVNNPDLKNEIVKNATISVKKFDISHYYEKMINEYKKI